MSLKHLHNGIPSLFTHRIKINGEKQQTVSQLYEKQLCNKGEGGLTL